MLNKTKRAGKGVMLFGLFLLLNLYSCGFAYVQHVTGKYFIVGVDTKEDVGLSYKLASGEYIGKAPGKLLQYGFNDRFLVANTLEPDDSSTSFYVIDMTKDSDFAHEKIFRIGPLSALEYNQNWNNRLKIRLKNVR